LESIGPSRSYIDRLPVPENGRVIFVNATDIEWIESAGNYVRVHAQSRHHDIRETLSNLEAKLNPREFVRIHRSAIVNLQHVKEVHPWFHGYHVVVLESGEKLRMSRYQKELAHRLGFRNLLNQI